MIPIEPTPFAHFNGKFEIMSWKRDEAFFFDPQELIGRTIADVLIDDPEAGCLRIEFEDGGGFVATLEDRENSPRAVLSLLPGLVDG